MKFQAIILTSLLMIMGCDVGGGGAGIGGPGNGGGAGNVGVPGGIEDVASVVYEGQDQYHIRGCGLFEISLRNNSNQLILASENIPIMLSVFGNAEIFQDAQCTNPNNELTVLEGTTRGIGFIKTENVGSINILYNGVLIQQGIQMTTFAQNFANNLAGNVFSIETDYSTGTIFVAGDFTSLSGNAHNRLVKLRVNGSIDPDFNLQGGFSNTLQSVKQDNSGNLYVVGSSFIFQDLTNRHFAKIDPTGLLDPIVGAKTFSGQPVNRVLFDADKIILVGNFVSYFDQNTTILQNRITKLNAEGNQDSNFNPGQGFDVEVFDAVVDASGKIISTGGFSTYNSISRNGFARINSNGSLDTTFNVGTALGTGSGRALALASDGKIYVGGNFTAYNGTNKNGLVRVNSNGSLDTTFNTVGTGFNNGATVYAIALAPDGKIYVGGDFTSYNGTNVNRIVRLNSNGSVDGTFSIGTGFNAAPRTIKMAPDFSGDLYVGGEFTQYKNVNRSYLVRLDENGNPD